MFSLLRRDVELDKTTDLLSLLKSPVFAQALFGTLIQQGVTASQTIGTIVLLCQPQGFCVYEYIP